MAQVCQIRDDSGLSGGRELAQGAWLQDIRCGHRRPGGSTENISGPALPVPPDDDCKALSDRQSRHEASRELLSLSCGMTRMDKDSFIGAFDEWYVK